MITMILPPGVTYRQLRYWVSQGYLPATLTAGSAPTGGKMPADVFSIEQWTMLTVMGKLRMAGIDACVAGPIARKSIERTEDGHTRTMLWPGIHLVVDLSAIKEPLPK
jgi:hypothetical protein